MHAIAIKHVQAGDIYTDKLVASRILALAMKVKLLMNLPKNQKLDQTIHQFIIWWSLDTRMNILFQISRDEHPKLIQCIR